MINNDSVVSWTYKIGSSTFKKTGKILALVEQKMSIENALKTLNIDIQKPYQFKDKSNSSRYIIEVDEGDGMAYYTPFVVTVDKCNSALAALCQLRYDQMTINAKIKEAAAALERDLNQKRKESYAKTIEQVASILNAAKIPFADAVEELQKLMPIQSLTSNFVIPKPIKYMNEDGKTWSGRGRNPLWFKTAMAQGRKESEFLV